MVQIEEDEVFSILTGKISTAINRTFLRSFAQEGIDITTEQWSVLACLWKKDSVTQQTLCMLTSKDKPSMTTVFVIGIEMKEKTSRVWLRTADNNFITALMGKLLPYTAIFIVMGFLSNIILFGFLHFPLNACLFKMLLATVCYVIACQSVGLLIIGVLPVLRDSVSIVMIYGMFGFTFSGFTFPIEQMPYPARIFSFIYPIRHYFNIYIEQALHEQHP